MSKTLTWEQSPAENENIIHHAESNAMPGRHYRLCALLISGGIRWSLRETHRDILTVYGRNLSGGYPTFADAEQGKGYCEAMDRDLLHQNGEAPRGPNPLEQPTIALSPNGWIPCSEAQPDFRTPVAVLIQNGESKEMCVGIGSRGSRIDTGKNQEIWTVRTLDPLTGGIIAWHPLPPAAL